MYIQMYVWFGMTHAAGCTMVFHFPIQGSPGAPGPRGPKGMTGSAVSCAVISTCTPTYVCKDVHLCVCIYVHCKCTGMRLTWRSTIFLCYQGDQGPQGAPGVPGQAGAKGMTGDRGFPGLSGPDGDRVSMMGGMEGGDAGSGSGGWGCKK